MSNPNEPAAEGAWRPADLQSRRGLLAKTLALAFWAAAYVTPVAAGVVTFLNPLRQKGRSGEDFLRLTALETLPEDGTPKRFPVVADRADAWNFYPNEPIGSVFLRRTGKSEVVAFQVVCPHAGCAIEYVEEPGEEKGQTAGKFFCPCHKASFSLEGERADAVSESPRDMDALEVKVVNGEVLVQFQNFRTGTPEKVIEL
jgi:menaquinol-cytochrome c reductase iron-sulfur subunit